MFHHARPNRTAKPGDWLSLDNAFDKRGARRAFLTFRFHDLRHSFVTRKLSEGVAVQLVMRYVGDADERRRSAIHISAWSTCCLWSTQLLRQNGQRREVSAQPSSHDSHTPTYKERGSERESRRPLSRELVKAA